MQLRFKTIIRVIMLHNVIANTYIIKQFQEQKSSASVSVQGIFFLKNPGTDKS